jgi:DNA modification methylase
MTEICKFYNKLICGCGIQGMKRLPDACIPLTVTSPPFDDLRIFGCHPFHFEPMARELWRVTAEGGVVCWHVQESIVNGSETGTSSEQRLFFRDLGFRLHHTLVITTESHTSSRVRYGSTLQYVFVLSKESPRTFNPIRDIPNKCAGLLTKYRNRHPDGSIRQRKTVVIKPTRMRGPVWPAYLRGCHATTEPEAFVHPALMHEELARDLIRSWSAPGDIVLDCMGGAGSTAKMALLEGRRFLSFEIFPEYHEIAVARLNTALRMMTQSLTLAS